MAKKVKEPTKEDIKEGIKFFQERVALWERIGNDKEVEFWKKHLLDYTGDPYGWKKKNYMHTKSKNKES